MLTRVPNTHMTHEEFLTSLLVLDYSCKYNNEEYVITFKEVTLYVGSHTETNKQKGYIIRHFCWTYEVSFNLTAFFEKRIAILHIGLSSVLEEVLRLIGIIESHEI